MSKDEPLMIVAVGSTNPTKIQAVKNAFLSKFPDVKVVGAEVSSGISEQPMSDEETKNGAENRARAALANLKKADLGFGLEGGVQKVKNGLMNSVWCCIVDREGNTFFTNGERFYLPHIIAEKVLNGQEMGPAIDEITREKGNKFGRGMIGIVTKNYLTRTEAYANLAKLAVGLWYGRGWEKEIAANA